MAEAEDAPRDPFVQHYYPYHFGIPVTPWYPQNPVPEQQPLPWKAKMAQYEAPKITVSLDDESKELLRALVKAVDRIAPAEPSDVSFGDGPDKRRLTEDKPKLLKRRINPFNHDGEGEHLLHDDEHEGEELE